MDLEYIKRIAARARRAQAEIDAIGRLRPVTRGRCICGREGELYTLRDTEGERIRCIECWKADLLPAEG